MYDWVRNAPLGAMDKSCEASGSLNENGELTKGLLDARHCKLLLRLLASSKSSCCNCRSVPALSQS